jgi:hypothetical protein
VKIRIYQSGKKCHQTIVTATGAACLAIGLIGPPPKAALAEPPVYVFTRLATVPGPGPGAELFDLDFEPHSINAAGNVGFAADLKSAGGADIGEGVFASRSGRLLQIMGPGQPAPGGGTFISEPGFGSLGLVPLNNAGTGAFVYVLSAFNPDTQPVGIDAGLYRFSLIRPRPAAVVVPGVTPAPTEGFFAGVFFNTNLNDREELVFAGIAPGLQQSGGPGFEGLGVGLFQANAANQISRLVIPGDPAPGGKVFDDAFSGWPNNRGTVGFEAHVTGDECVNIGSPLVCGSSLYKRSPQGDIESIAHQGDAAPGGGTYRLAFGAVVNEADAVVFTGDLTSPPDSLQTLGVFVNSQGQTVAVARPGDAMPGGGHFVTASQFPFAARLNNRGQISFVARLDTIRNGVGDTGLYVLTQGRFILVARTGTFIPGVGTIAQINNPLLASAPGAAIFDEPAINDLGQIFFEATLTDGTGVLLIASPRGAR